MVALTALISYKLQTVIFFSFYPFHSNFFFLFYFPSLFLFFSQIYLFNSFLLLYFSLSSPKLHVLPQVSWQANSTAMPLASLALQLRLRPIFHTILLFSILFFLFSFRNSFPPFLPQFSSRFPFFLFYFLFFLPQFLFRIIFFLPFLQQFIFEILVHSTPS